MIESQGPVTIIAQNDPIPSIWNEGQQRNFTECSVQSKSYKLCKIKFPDIHLMLEDIFKRLKQYLVDVVIS